MADITKIAIAVLHFFLATFVWVQVSVPITLIFGDNKIVNVILFILISLSVFYLSYRKAESPNYTIQKVFLITVLYFIVSTIFVVLSLQYLNIILIMALYYYLFKKESIKILNKEL